MKKIKKGLSILVLLICSISALGQPGPSDGSDGSQGGGVSGKVIYEVTQSTLDCENNKVCYTIAVKAADDLADGKPFYYDGATFRYFIDSSIFEEPVNDDYTILLLQDNKYRKYINNQDEVRTTPVGNKLGFKSKAYWVKTSIKASNSPEDFPRVRITTEPVEIMKICLTPRVPLNSDSSKENLCYPFVFDSNDKHSDWGIIVNTEGIVTTFTDKANNPNGVNQFKLKERTANQYLWELNENWDGNSNNATGKGSIGSPATEGCLQNSCLCYAKPTKKGTALETFAGISTLDRNVDASWVDNAKSGFLKLESKTLGFVPTRVNDTSGIENPEEGMVVWNITNKCLEYYDGTKWVCSVNKCKENNQ